MSMNDIVQGCGKIWNRLFDHRGFLNGEINFLLKEFEQNRKDKEIDNLFSVIETITDLRDTQVPRLKNHFQDSVPDLFLDLDNALGIYERILTSENDPDRNNTLEKNRERRKLEWERFMAEIEKGYSEVDSSFEDKEKALREQYNKSEKQLKTTAHCRNY